MPFYKFHPDVTFFLPISLFYQTITGDYVHLEETENQWVEADVVLRPDMGTASAVPWAEDVTLQVINDLETRSGDPLAVAPRNMKPMHAQGGLPVPDIHHIDQPNWYAEGGDQSPETFGLERACQLESAIQELGENEVAAFIAEPVQGAGGVIIPPASYWPEIQRICDAHDILLIADEVICGFGRTGNWFGSETFAIRPDIMTIAKGLSSGYMPIGGSLVSDEVASVIASAGDFNHGYTYSGHPVAAAVAMENLRIMEEEQLVETVREETAPYLAEQWSALADHPLIGEARIIGLMGSLALTPDKASRAAFAAGTGVVGLRCRERCFANGLVMRHVGDRMIIAPPLVITKAEIDMLIERATRSLDETLVSIKEDGLYKAA